MPLTRAKPRTIAQQAPSDCLLDRVVIVISLSFIANDPKEVCHVNVLLYFSQCYLFPKDEKAISRPLAIGVPRFLPYLTSLEHLRR